MSNDEERDRWNHRYNTDDYVFGTAPNRFLAAQAERLRPGMRALAIADGEGRNGVWLAGQGLEVLSVDFSPVALEKARKLAVESGVELQTECVDLQTWDWGEERFDVVAAIFIQFAAPSFRELIFRRIRQVLRPGGLLLLEGYRPEQLDYKTGGPGVAENLYTETLLRTAFAGMEILHLASYDQDIREGCGHGGMSALIDLVARKR